MKINKLTPVRIVEAIEPCLPFWCDALGYEKKTEVPHGDRLGFVILEGSPRGRPTRSCSPRSPRWLAPSAPSKK